MRQRRNQLFVYRAAGLVLSLAIHALIIFLPIGMRAIERPFIVALNIDEVRKSSELVPEAPKVVHDPIGHIRDMPADAKTVEARGSLQESPGAQEETASESLGPSVLEKGPGPALTMPSMSAVSIEQPVAPIEQPVAPIATSEMQQCAPAEQRAEPAKGAQTVLLTEPPARPASQEAPAVALAAPQAGSSAEPTFPDIKADAPQPASSQALSVSQAEKSLPAKPKLTLSRESLASGLIALPQSIAGNLPSGKDQAKRTISGPSMQAVQSSAQSSAQPSAGAVSQEGVSHDDAEEIRAEHANDFLAKRKSASLTGFQAEQKPGSTLVPSSFHESQLQPVPQGGAEPSSAGSPGARPEKNAVEASKGGISGYSAHAETPPVEGKQPLAAFAPAEPVTAETKLLNEPKMGLASIEGARIGPASTELSSTRPVAAEQASVEPASTESSSTKLGALPLASIEAASPEASRAEPAQSEPPPSLSTAPVPASFDTVESLAAAITDRLIAHKQYPAAALKRKSEGTVRIALQVAPDGTLASLAIQSRSGSAILDEAALQLVRSIFPLHIRLEAAVSLLIPVEYRIPK